MSEQLFSKREFIEYQNKIFVSVKKNLQSTVEINTQMNPFEAASDSEQTIFTGQGTFMLTYGDQKLALPVQLLEVDTIREIFNQEDFEEVFTEQQRAHLYGLLPNSDPKIMRQLLAGENFHFGNPMDIFTRQLKKGVFTPLWRKQQQLQQQQFTRHLLDYSKSLLKSLQSHPNNHPSPPFRLHELQHLSQSQITSLQDLQINNFSEASDQTQTDMKMHENEDDPAKAMNEVFFKYEDRRKTQEELIAMSDDRADYKTKVARPVSTVKQTKCVDWIEIYRKQEEERYKHPTVPWTYTCQDGRKVIVAPVSRKAPPPGCKPRQHDLLKQQRPACVTILTLVRDAAARLPGGVGTRADICQLLKQSQYVNDELDDKLISSIVSGALDRLHYMSDACVKYDNQKKLWLYLHLDRNDQHRWEDNEEYNVKKSYKKRKGDDYDMDRFQ